MSNEAPVSTEAKAPAGQRRREKRDVHGWVVLDKPVGMTSTHAVSIVKRLFKAKRAGHAGTLDPLASGLLPIALGEATKTVPFVMEGRKRYRFTVRWGEERDTDDAEGRVVATSADRPSAAAVRALLPSFTGTIAQVPPRYSAIKIEGERAYDLAREGEVVELEPRPVDIHRLELVETAEGIPIVRCSRPSAARAPMSAPSPATWAARSAAIGHVVELRRTLVGPFGEGDAVSVDALQGDADGTHQAATVGVPGSPLLPVEAGLAALPALAVSRSDAARLARGQAVLLRGRDAPVMSGCIAVLCQGSLLALADVEKGELHPRRIFNFGLSHG